MDIDDVKTASDMTLEELRDYAYHVFTCKARRIPGAPGPEAIFRYSADWKCLYEYLDELVKLRVKGETDVS